MHFHISKYIQYSFLLLCSYKVYLLSYKLFFLFFYLKMYNNFMFENVIFCSSLFDQIKPAATKLSSLTYIYFCTIYNAIIRCQF